MFAWAMQLATISYLISIWQNKVDNYVVNTNEPYIISPMKRKNNLHDKNLQEPVVHMTSITPQSKDQDKGTAHQPEREEAP